MAQSSDISAGAEVIIDQYNNLRADVLSATLSHDHSGAADHGIKINHNNLLGVTANQHHAGFIGLEDHDGVAVSPAADDRIQIYSANNLLAILAETNKLKFTVAEGNIDHNSVSGHQGGTTAEYYHLTSSEHTELTAWLDDVVLSDGGAMSLNDANITNVGEIDLDLIRADAADGSITIELDNAAGADLLVGNNNALVVEGDNDRVGIGVAAPGVKLDAAGKIRSVGAEYSVTLHEGGGVGPVVYFGTTADEDALMTIGAYAGINNIDTKNRDLRIFSTADATGITYKQDTGNVGFGVTDPDIQVEILHAGDQLKLSFDGTDNAIFAVDTNGILTITPSGAAISLADKNITNVGDIALDTISADDGSSFSISSNWTNAGNTIADLGTVTTVIITTATISNTGLHLLDTGGDHDLIIAPGSDLSQDRTLTLTTGDAARTITLSGNPTLSDWFDQSVKQASSPTFVGLTLSSAISGITTLSMGGDLTNYIATNDANPQFRIGSADANEGHIQAFYDSGAQTLDYLLISTDSGTEGDIVLSPAGNVGIGTTAPAVRFEVENSGTDEKTYFSNDYGGSSDTTGTLNGLYFRSEYGATLYESAAIVDVQESGWDGSVGSHTRDSGLAFYTRDDDDFAERVRIDKDGNVGIGDTGPGTLLQLKGSDAYITLQNSTAENNDGGAETRILFEDHANAALAQIQGSHDGVADDTKGDLIFYTHSGAALIERVRVDSVGLVTLAGDLLVDGANIGITADADLITMAANTLTIAGTMAATTVTGANVTSGADPGHTHTGASLSGVDISADTNLAVTAPIVLTDDTLSHSAANGYVHTPASGASAQILQYSSAGTAKWITLSSDVTIADGGAMTVADDSHNHVYSNIDETASANWASRVSDETGSGAWVFANTPTLATPEIGVATGTSLDLGGTTLLASRALTIDTGGVFNIVLASAAGDDFTVDTDKLVVEGDTGNAGIGTATPGNKLDIITGATTSSGFHLGEVDNEGGYFTSTLPEQLIIGGGIECVSGSWYARGTEASMINLDNGSIHFYGDSSITPGSTFTPTERVVILADGNVGIGVPAPSAKLHIAGLIRTALEDAGTDDVAITLRLARFSTGTVADGFGQSIRFDLEDDGGTDQMTGVITNTWSDVSADESYFAFSLRDVSVAEKMRITAQGNVGIGVTDPDTLLELYKVGTQLKLSGGAADYATFAVAADGALTITTVDVDAAEGDIILMPDGAVLVGTSTATDALFTVQKDAGDYSDDDVAAIFGDATGAGASLYIIGDSLNATYNLDGEGTLRLNYRGYDAASTQYRNLYIYDGKGNAIAFWAWNVGESAMQFEHKGPVVFNEDSADYDFRIEGASDEFLFTLDADEDAIGIGYSQGQLDSTTGILLIDGNTGIGTTSPGHLLELKASAAAEYIAGFKDTEGHIQIRFRTDDDSGGTIQINDDDGTAVTQLQGRTGVNSYINNGGNVGIGTADPTYELDVVGNIGLSQYLYHNDDADTRIDFTPDNIVIEVGGEAMITLIEDDSQDIIELGDDGDIDIKLSGGADGALFVQGSTGYVGIGMVPAREFDVTGDIGLTGSIFINETANAEMTLGLTIHQGAATDEILAFKGDDIAHEAVVLAETDTYGQFRLVEAASGGLQIRGFKDAGGVNYQALVLQGHLAENVDTTKSAAGQGIVAIYGYQTGGGAVANIVGDGNVISIHTQRGGGGITLWILDEDGDTWQDGNIVVTDDSWIGIGASDERIIFDTAGNIDLMGCKVGIGTITPESDALVTIVSSGTQASLVAGNPADQSNVFLLYNSVNAGWGASADDHVLILNYVGYGGGVGYFRDLSINDGKMGEIAYFEGSTGNVGIGTTSPADKLSVNTEDATTDAATTILRLEHSTTGTAANGIGAGLGFIVERDDGALEWAASIEGIHTHATPSTQGALVFKTGPSLTEQVRIDNAGNVYPGGDKTQDLGITGHSWDDLWYVLAHVDADFYWMDRRITREENIVPIDDLSIICGIRPSGAFDNRTGLSLIDDSSLPEWLFSRDKITGKTVYNPNDGKPYLSNKMTTSLSWGAIRQLANQAESEKERIEQQISELQLRLATLEAILV